MGILEKLRGFFSRTRTDSRPEYDERYCAEPRTDRVDEGSGVSKVDFYANPGTYEHTPKPGVKSVRPFDFGYVEKKKESTPWEDFKKSYRDIVKKEEIK